MGKKIYSTFSNVSIKINYLTFNSKIDQVETIKILNRSYPTNKLLFLTLTLYSKENKFIKYF